MTRFCRWPAAIKLHGAVLGGLLEHTVNVTTIAESLAQIYSCNQYLVLAGALLHDIGKLEELSEQIGADYTPKGHRIGHIVLGMQYVEAQAQQVSTLDKEAPLLAGKVVAEVWHYPKGFLPMGSQVRRPKVGTIADTILQFYADKYPQYRSRFAYDYWIAMLKNAVRKLDCIITVSEFSKRSILEFAERYHIKAPPICVTYQGATAFAQATSEQLSRDYVMHFASKAPHKKTNWLLEQWERLQKEGVLLPKLRLVGDIDRAAARLLAELKNATITNWISSEQIGSVLSRALALILPSELEGFGLPALEAYFCNTPVVYVKGTAVEEVLGPGSVGGFNFEDESFPTALNDVLALDVVQINQKRHELDQRFSWHKCAARTLESYRRIEP